MILLGRSTLMCLVGLGGCGCPLRTGALVLLGSMATVCSFLVWNAPRRNATKPCIFVPVVLHVVLFRTLGPSVVIDDMARTAFDLCVSTLGSISCMS